MLVFSAKRYFFALTVLTVFVDFVNGFREILINQYLDIILAFDQSTSMLAREDRMRIYDAFANWVRYYKGKEKQTRFSVIGCAGNRDHVLFRDSENVDLLTEKIKNYMPYSKNPRENEDFDVCFWNVQQFFREDRGGRPDATKVVLLITDCLHHTSDSRLLLTYTDSFSGLRSTVEKTGGYFGIVCMMMAKSNGDWFCFSCRDFEYLTWVWAAKNWRNIINFTETDQLQNQLDAVLPKRELYKTRDCEERDEWTECEPIWLLRQCQRSKPIIIVQPYNDSHARQCSPIISEYCPCPTTIITTTSTTTSTTTTSTTTKIPSTTTTEPSSTTKKLPTTTKEPSTTTRKSSTTTKSTTSTTLTKKPTTTKKKQTTTSKQTGKVTKKSSDATKTLYTEETEEEPPADEQTHSAFSTIRDQKRTSSTSEIELSMVAYIGIIVGGLLLLFVVVLLILLAVFCGRSQKNKRKPSRAEESRKRDSVSKQTRVSKKKGVHSSTNVRTKSKTLKKENLTKHGGKNVTDRSRQRLKGVHVNIAEASGSKVRKHEKKGKSSLPSHSQPTTSRTQPKNKRKR